MSKLERRGGDLTVDLSELEGRALLVTEGGRRSLLLKRELQADLAALEEMLAEAEGAGAPILRGSFGCSDVRAIGSEDGIELASVVPGDLDVDERPVGRAGGAAASGYMLVVERDAPLTPAIRRLCQLPPERSAGLLPLLQAVGAEPVALLDSVGPMADRLAERGAGHVGVIARAGAFLWELDLRGREGRDATAAQRIDEDVVMPLLGGLDASGHLKVGGSPEDLLEETRSGQSELGFVFPPEDRALIEACAKEGAYPAFSAPVELPGGLVFRS